MSQPGQGARYGLDLDQRVLVLQRGIGGDGVMQDGDTHGTKHLHGH